MSQLKYFSFLLWAQEIWALGRRFWRLCLLPRLSLLRLPEALQGGGRAGVSGRLWGHCAWCGRKGRASGILSEQNLKGKILSTLSFSKIAAMLAAGFLPMCLVLKISVPIKSPWTVFITGAAALKWELQAGKGPGCPGALLSFHLCPQQPSCNAAAASNSLITRGLF